MKNIKLFEEMFFSRWEKAKQAHKEGRKRMEEERRKGLEDAKITARQIVVNNLKMYNLDEVENKNIHEDLANQIINDLVNAGFMR